MPLKESQTVELKRSLAQLGDALKSICGFLNHKGGMVYFGVNDDGRVIGLDVSDKTLRKISQLASQKIKPEVALEIKEIRKEDKSVIEVRIREGGNKPYFLEGVAYKRTGTEDRIMPPDELKKIILEQKRTSWDGEVCDGAAMEDIDNEKVRWFLRKSKLERRLEINSTISVKETLKRLELLKNGKLTNAAILLFGKNPQGFFLQSEVRCARFKGTEPLEFLDMKVFGGNIIDQREDTIEFVKEHIRLHAEIVGTERVETWEYPIEAIREAITNAICHRDYEISSNVQVRIFDDRMEVWGCGSLPEPLTVEDLRRDHRSILRNPLIGKCFFLIKFIEEWGTGTNRIIEWCLKYDLPEPVFAEVAGGLVVILRKPPILEDLEKMSLNERQIKAINYVVQRDSISNREYQELNKVSKRTATLDLTALVDKGIFGRIGKGKRGLRYILLSKKYPKSIQKSIQNKNTDT